MPAAPTQETHHVTDELAPRRAARESSAILRMLPTWHARGSAAAWDALAAGESPVEVLARLPPAKAETAARAIDPDHFGRATTSLNAAAGQFWVGWVDACFDRMGIAG